MISRADSLTIELPLFQAEGGGSTPTSALHPKQFRCEPCSLIRVRDFIQKWHYSHNVWGVNWTYCFALTHNHGLYGAAMVGQPATKSVADKHGGLGSVLELRRFCCCDSAPKFSESFFIACIIRWLKKKHRRENVYFFCRHKRRSYGHNLQGFKLQTNRAKQAGNCLATQRKIIPPQINAQQKPQDGRLLRSRIRTTAGA